MSNVNYGVSVTNYVANTILYAEDLKSNFTRLNNVINGLVTALSTYYEGTDVTVGNTTSAAEVEGILKNCLENLFKRIVGEDTIDQIKINKVNTPSNGGIELSHKKDTNNSPIIKINDDGIELSSDTLTIKLQRTDTNNGTNILEITSTPNRVDINGRNIIYSVTDTENSNGMTRINQLYYDALNKTIYFN